MKIIVISLLVIFSFQFALAKNESKWKRANFKIKSHWFSSRYKNYESGGTSINLKSFQRFIFTGKKSYPVASATFTHIYEKKASDSIDSIAKGIKAGFGAKTKWKTTKLKNGLLLRGAWESANRSIRVLLLRPKAKEFVVFTSFARKGYLNSIAGEIEILESTINNFYLGKKKKAFIDFFITPAYAQFLPFVGPTSTPLDATAESLTENVDALTASVDELNSSVDDVISESDQWQEIIPATSDQWANQSDQWRAMVEGQSEAWGARFDQLLDPKHMAMVGFATAAGAAFGTLAVNLAVDGAVLGITKLFDLIFQVSANKERWENFSEARELWEEAEKNALGLEAALDQFIAAYESIENTRGEDLLAGLQKSYDQLSFIASEFKKKYENIKDCSGDCNSQVVYQNMLMVQRQMKDYEKVLEFAKENRINNVINSENFYCDRLAEMKRKINQAELQLNELRIALIDGQAEWYRHERQRFNERQNSIDRINRQRLEEEEFYNQEMRLSDRLLDKVAREARKLEREIPDHWMDQCIDGSSPIGIEINAEFSRFTLFREFKVMNLCKEAYAQTFASLHQETRQEFDDLLHSARIQAQRQYENARFRKIYDNPNAEMNHIIDMEQWFTKLEYESECYGQIDQAGPRYKALCNKLSPKLVALREASKKADAEYKLKCEAKWDDLQAEFQQFHRGYTEEEQIEAYRAIQNP